MTVAVPRRVRPCEARNAVLRWEYRPGSTLFVVWQQDRLTSDYERDFSIGRAFSDVFAGRANNVLAVVNAGLFLFAGSGH